MTDQEYRVLVVDDDEDMNDLIVTNMVKQGYRTESAYTGAEAIRQFEKSFYHLFILDLALPDIHGLDILEKLDVKNNIYEVIIVTGHGDLDSARRAMELGAFSFLSKPLVNKDLRNMAKKALEMDALKNDKHDYENDLEKIVRTRTNKLKKEVFKHKQAETALQESQIRYKELYNGIGDAIFICNSQGGFVDCNEITLQRLGYTRKDFLRLKTIDIVHPDYHTAMKKNQKKIWSGKEAIFESKHLCKDGSIIPVEIKAKKIVYQETPAIFSIVSDITERKKIEKREAFNKRVIIKNEQKLVEAYERLAIHKEQLDKQNKFHNELLESLTHPFYVIDVNDYSVILANSSALVREISESRKCYKLFHNDTKPCDGPNHVCPISEVKRTGKPTVLEHIHSMGDTPVTLELHAYPIFNSKGKVIQIIEYCLDITKRKVVEEKLRQSQSELRDLAEHLQSIREEERTAIAREVHDELGQVLTALKMDLSWLKKKLPHDQEALYNKTDEMRELINATIKTVKRISSDLRPGLLDDLGLVAAMEWQIEESGNRAGIDCTLTTDFDEEKLDENRNTTLFRILQETLTNVIRHAEATKVAVSLKEESGNIELKIEDNGKGIAEENITDPKSLGLIGIRERARSWGGDVKFKGENGKGSTVWVSIPFGKTENRKQKTIGRKRKAVSSKR